MTSGEPASGFATGARVALRPAILVFALTLLTATSAAAQLTVRMLPEAPTNTTPIVLDVIGFDPGSQLPEDPRVRVEGFRIDIDMNITRGGGLGVGSYWYEKILLGALQPGDYEVFFKYRRGNDTPVERFPIEVRDVTTLPIIEPVRFMEDPERYIVKLEWKTRTPRQVWFDDVPGFTGGALHFQQALIGPGLHDVKVEYDDGSVDLARNAILVKPRSDPAPFGERFLVPVYVNGGGWTSELEATPESVDLHAWDVVHKGRAAGVWLNVPPRTATRTGFSLRVGATGGPMASVPVPRESEFRSGQRRLSTINLKGSERITVRVYSMKPGTFSIDGLGQRGVTVTTVRHRPDEPAFASAEFTGIGVSAVGVNVTGDELFWAMASAFDPSTKTLSIATPLR